MRPKIAKVLVSLLAAFSIAACSADGPADDIPAPAPDAGQEQMETVPLSASADAAATPWTTVMVTGTGPAQGTLIINSPARGEETRSLGSTGDFCIDVALSDGENMIKMEAIAAGGDYSEPVFVTVTREGEPPESEGDDPTVGDRTDGATYYNNADGTTVGGVTALEGEWNNLVNGDTGDLLKFEGTWANNEAVAYKLSERMVIRTFEITVPANDGPGCGPEAFEVYIADGPEPEMAFDGINWVKVAEAEGDDILEDGGTYRLQADFEANSTHFAVMGTNPSCTPYGYYNNYGFNEVRVLADEQGSQIDPDTQAPNCANSN